jgi:hypothetical protein
MEARKKKQGLYIKHNCDLLQISCHLLVSEVGLKGKPSMRITCTSGKTTKGHVGIHVNV